MDFRQDLAGLFDRVQRVIEQLLCDRAGPQVRVAAEALRQLRGTDELEISAKGERRPPRRAVEFGGAAAMVAPILAGRVGVWRPARQTLAYHGRSGGPAAGDSVVVRADLPL